jgi:hypothetical protein
MDSSSDISDQPLTGVIRPKAAVNDKLAISMHLQMFVDAFAEITMPPPHQDH